MPHVQGEPGAGRPAATRRHRAVGADPEQLFGVVAGLLAGKDLAELTVDDIAAAAGVAKGTVFYRYGSKEGLFTALLHHGVEQFTAELADALAAATPAAALLAVVDAQLAFMARHPAFARLLVAEMWRSERAWAETVALVRDRAVAVVAEAVRRGQRSGAVAADPDPELAAPAIVGMTAFAALHWLNAAPGLSRADVLDGLRAMLPLR